MSKRSIVHIEIPTDKGGPGAGDFYRDLFGWEVQYDEALDYAMFNAEPVAGGFNKVGDQVKAGQVILYLDSEDIEADLEAIKKAGGDEVLPKTEIPNMGWFAWFSDPTGNTLGLYTPMQQDG